MKLNQIKQGVTEGKIQYGVLDHDNVNLIIDKSESKPDGVYSFRGILFKVKGGKVTHYATDGKILRAMGQFNTQIGSYATNNEAKNILKGIKQGVSEGDSGWDDPRYDRRPSDRDEDDEYDRYRQSKLDDEAEAEKKPTGFQVYDGTTRQYIGKVFRTQAEAVQFRAMQPGREHMSIQMVPLQETDSKNPHTSLLGRALHTALSKQKKASPLQVQRNKERWEQRQKEREHK